MVKVGLFLASAPFDGGAFQYSQSVLHALTDDPPDQLTTTVFYTNDAWREAAESLSIGPVAVEVSAIDQLLLKLVKFGVIPLAVWRLVAAKVHGLTRLLLAQDCDIWVFPSQDVWSYFFPLPAVVSIFDLMHRYERRFPEVSRGFKYYRRESHYKKICSSATGLLVDSAVGRQQVEESYAVDPGRVHVLPFIAPPHLQSSIGSNVENLDLPGKYLFYPAQFWRHKNHLRLVRALAELVEKCPDIQLLLVGSRKNNHVRVKQLIEDLGLTGHIRILGYVSDRQIVSLYRNARALVMPTFFGPTNIPPLEAMALGCPVAVSNIYAIPEQMGGAGLLFDPKSIEEISQAMYRLWTDDGLCAELARKGLEQHARWTQTQYSERLQQIVVDAAAAKSY